MPVPRRRTAPGTLAARRRRRSSLRAQDRHLRPRFAQRSGAAHGGPAGSDHVAADPRSGIPARRAQDLSDDDRAVADGHRFVQTGGSTSFPEFAPAAPFPTAEAEEHQLAAIRRMAVDDSYTAPDQALVAEALEKRLHDLAAGARLQAAAGRPGGGRAQGMDSGQFRRPQRRQGVCAAFRQDASRRHLRRIHL